MVLKLTTNDQRPTTNYGKIGILMGGTSSEREISLKSGRAVFEALRAKGCDVEAIDIRSEEKKENVRLIRAAGVDCAFIALHGRFGEDGQIQEILDAIGLPYTGSGARASRLAMDKIAARHAFEAAGLKGPKYKILDKDPPRGAAPGLDGLDLPIVAKPASHGSSIGLSIVDKAEDLDKAINLAFDYDTRILLEEYIPGRELTVGILEDRALPVIQVVPKNKFFDYEAKYRSGMTEYIVPARIKENEALLIQEAALAAHKVLGCWGCSRTDIILGEDGLAYVLELNSIPGLTGSSLLPKAAKEAGIEFPELCLTLVRLAYEKK